MILGNTEILEAIKAGRLKIGDLTGNEDPGQQPFNTTSIDLHLNDQISVLQVAPAAFDLRKPGISKFLSDNSKSHKTTLEQPFTLRPGDFVLASTQEKIILPIVPEKNAYSARVEGRSSIARCGVLVHFTAPTIHAGFSGQITLEIANLGPIDFLLYPGLAICQLIFEEVLGKVVPTENQFIGQTTPSGL